MGMFAFGGNNGGRFRLLTQFGPGLIDSKTSYVCVNKKQGEWSKFAKNIKKDL